MFRFRWLAVVLLGSACRSSARDARADSAQAASASSAPLDDFGTPVVLARPPRRIVSLNPTTTELLFAIGAGGRLVGRSHYDVYPDSARAVPDVGPSLRPNVESVLAARPDLVVLYASEDDRPALAQLRHAGISTLALKIDNIEQFERDTRLLGRVTGDSARAARVVDSVAGVLARVRAATTGLPRPAVLIPTWDRPIIAIGAGSFMSELLDIAGARNVYADVAAPSVTVTFEDVLKRNPDVVLTTPTSAATIRASAEWRTLPAVRAGRVLTLDTLLVERPSVQLGAAALSLAELFHPGAVR